MLSTVGPVTSQMVSRRYNPNLCLVEVIRVTKSSRDGWAKSNASLSFSLTDLVLPGFERGYRVVGTCHHTGSLNSGHWITKICTNQGWFELDDLRGNSLPTNPPGASDVSVAPPHYCWRPIPFLGLDIFLHLLQHCILYLFWYYLCSLVFLRSVILFTYIYHPFVNLRGLLVIPTSCRGGDLFFGIRFRIGFGARACSQLHHFGNPKQ